MKILYVTIVDLSLESGVRKKIYGQVNAMKKAGFDIALIAPNENKIVVENVYGKKVLGKYNINRFFRIFSKPYNLYKATYRYTEKEKIKAVFIRYPRSGLFFLNLLRRLKGDFVKIFIEIASYPYDFEFEGKEGYKKLGLYIDKIFRKNLKKYVDLIFTPSPVSGEIYGIKACSFDNGVDVGSITKREYTGSKKNTLRFIGVANLSPWHGYDRVIRGIAKYYEKDDRINFLFNVVGEGRELGNLKRLTQGLDLEERVVFHGEKYGRELDEIYNSSDVAISSIGFLRKAKSLKTREACLKGIPFVEAKGDPVFGENFKYVYLIEEKDTAVDVESIYNWFSKLDSNVYLEEMYNWGKENLGWDKTFRGVIEEIKGIISYNSG